MEDQAYQSCHGDMYHVNSGLIQSLSQGLLAVLRAWAEFGGIARVRRQSG